MKGLQLQCYVIICRKILNIVSNNTFFFDFTIFSLSLLKSDQISVYKVKIYIY